jgi:hypothetical protein
MRVSSGTDVTIGVGSTVGVAVADVTLAVAVALAVGLGVLETVSTALAAVGSGVSVDSRRGVAVACVKGGRGFVGVAVAGGGSQQPPMIKDNSVIPNTSATSVLR